jgi:hypothetical protein
VPNKHHNIAACWFCFPPLIFACGSAQANGARCDAPPYGDAAQNYDAMYSEFAQASAAAPDLPPGMLMHQLEAALIEACKAKFQHGSRASYYRHGLSDAYINDASTTALANAWFQLRNKALAKELEADKPPPPVVEDESRIYALFLCVRVTMTCQMQGAPRMTFGGPMPGMFYRSFAECANFAHQISMRKPTDDGHFPIGVDNAMWYECRSKHVDEWESAPQK